MWEKEKVYTIEWTETGSTTSDDRSYNDYLYTSYKITDGKIIPGEKAKYGLWGSLFYYIRYNRIKKIDYSGTKIVDTASGTRQIINYKIYDGKIVGKYR